MYKVYKLRVRSNRVSRIESRLRSVVFVACVQSSSARILELEGSNVDGDQEIQPERTMQRFFFSSYTASSLCIEVSPGQQLYSEINKKNV